MPRPFLLPVLASCGGPSGVGETDTDGAPSFATGAFADPRGEWELAEDHTLPDQHEIGWAADYIHEGWPAFPCETGGNPLYASQGLLVREDGAVDWVFDAQLRCDDWSQPELHSSTSYARLALVRQDVVSVADGELRYDIYAVEDARSELIAYGGYDESVLGPEWSVEDVGEGWVRVRDDEVTWLMARGPIDWDE
jgi:hypothetical protein